MIKLSVDRGGYDIVRGAVVRAESRQRAWEILADDSGIWDEREDFIVVPLTVTGPSELVLIDFLHG